MTSMHAKTRAKEQRHAEKRMAKAGYATGGAVESQDDAKEDVKRVKKAFTEHDDQLHGGKKTKLKLRHGGRAEGKDAHHSVGRRARGGSIPHKGKGNINIIIKNPDQAKSQLAAQQGQKQGMQQGMRMGAQLGARRAAQNMQQGPKPPMPGGGGMPAAGPGGAMPPMGPGGPPPGAMPPQQRPPGMMARGGKVKVREHERRARGGSLRKDGAIAQPPETEEPIRKFGREIA